MLILQALQLEEVGVEELQIGWYLEQLAVVQEADLPYKIEESDHRKKKKLAERQVPWLQEVVSLAILT